MGLPPHFSARLGRRRPDGMDSLSMPRTLSRGGLRYPRDIFGRGRHYIWEGVFNGANIAVLCAAYPEANGAAEISRNQAIFTASFKCGRELMRKIPQEFGADSAGSKTPYCWSRRGAWTVWLECGFRRFRIYASNSNTPARWPESENPQNGRWGRVD